MKQQGTTWVWQPNHYPAMTPITQDYQTKSWSALDGMLAQYHAHYPSTKFILVGHSLGGVVAFEELAKQRGMYGSLAKLITIDSPLDGIPANVMLASGVLLGKGVPRCAIVGPAAATLVGIHNLGTNKAVLRAAVKTAQAHHIQVVTAGNQHDGLLQPTECGIAVGGDINSQWLGGATVLRFDLKKAWSLPWNCVSSTHSAALTDPGAIARLAQTIGPATPILPPGSVSEYPLPPGSNPPEDITTGPDGSLWFLEGNKIGRITAHGAIREFPLPAGVGAPGVIYAPAEITAGPDRNLWFTAPQANAIGRTTLSGITTMFAVPTPHSSPNGITQGPDGNLWFTEWGTGSHGAIGRITTDGKITEYPLPAPSYASGIAMGPDGNLWFCESIVSKIGRITPKGVLTEFALPGHRLPGIPVGPHSITLGPNGNLWFTDFYSDTNLLGHINTHGVFFHDFALPGEQRTNLARAITRGRDGSLWIADTYTLDRITVNGAGSIFASNGGFRNSITSVISGPDGNLWYTMHTDTGQNAIGRMVLPPLSSGLVISAFIPTTGATFNDWTRHHSAGPPQQASVFPAGTSEIAYYLQYENADPGHSRFRVAIVDIEANSAILGIFHSFPQRNGSFMTKFYDLSLHRGEYLMELYAGSSHIAIGAASFTVSA
jgi:virginiamycin B lyase